MNVLKALFWVLVISINGSVLTYQLTAQSIPDIPFDIDFAGVTVHLNEQSQVQLQREVGRLYANRPGLQRDVESLRQLTPLLEPLLKAERLPMDYRYAMLPFADDETTGYWGLTPGRALALNMVMNEAVDERYHPILATETVTAHLSRLHTVSDNYVLTLLRYLQGDTLTDRLTDKANSTYLLLDAQSPLLMWRIIARKLAFEREEPVLRSAQPYLLYELHNGAGHSIRTIGRQLQLDEERFKPFNAWLKAGTIPDEKEYPVLIRVTADEFPAVKSRDEVRLKPSVVGEGDVGFPMLTKLPSSTVSTFKSAVFYKLNDRLGVQAQPCDNVITLAHYGKIKIKTLLSYNELSGQDVVLPGQIYYLERKAKRAKVPFHVVQKNQTLREIANVYGVRLKSLLRFNRLRPTQRVQTGRIVWLRKKRPRRQPVEYRQPPVEAVKSVIEDGPVGAPPIPNDSLVRHTDSLAHQPSIEPAPTTADKAEPVNVLPPDKNLFDELAGKESIPPTEPVDKSGETLKLHVVRRGQTYYGISQLYGVTPKQLYGWNNLSERIPLKIGQELIVNPARKRLPSEPAKPAMVTKPRAQSKPGAINSSVVDPADRAVYHVVRPGQTVYRVALINKVSIPDLMRWNNLKNYTIEVGRKLLIQKSK